LLPPVLQSPHNPTGCLQRSKAAKEGLPFVLRRSKEQVTDLKGRPLFKRREVRSLAVSLTEAERHLYEAVTAYVRRWYSTVSGRTDRRSRNVALALTVLQRRLASSLSAVRESLRRRRSKLQHLLEEWERRTEEEETLPILDEESWAELSDQTAAEWETFQERLEGMTAAETPEELREEISELDELIHLALEAEKAGEEAKVRELHRVVEDRLSHYPEEKLLIFTEFKDTLQALRRKLEQEWGFQVAVIHGGMNLQSRIEAERCFRDRVQVMVATDAAGEGINLQFCRLMVNFDLPWNPNRLEQRMGRIHRYGQKRDCYVFNMLYPETREGRVLERLLEKLERMRDRLGDSVYDVIGQLLEGVRLEELLMQAILRQDTTEVERIIDVDVERRLEEYRRALEESALAGHHIDLSGVVQKDRDSLQKRLVPWDVERFTRSAVSIVGGLLQPDSRRPGVWRLRVPREFLRQHQLRDESFHRGLRIAFVRKVARDSDAEFFAPGHPLLEALCDHFVQKERPVRAVLMSPQDRQGVLWLFRTKVQDGRGTSVLERLLPLFWDSFTGDVYEVDLRMVWDMEPFPDDTPLPDNLVQALDEIEGMVREKAIAYLEDLLEETQARREREARIKGEWLKRSFDELIAESNAKLLDYQRRAERGEDMRLAIQQEEEHLKSLVREQKERLEALRLEESLTLLEPELEAVALIVPATIGQTRPVAEEGRRRVEEAGMAFAMQYEREHGRRPQDISKEYRGYDIISVGPEEVRYIEVKAFSTTGAVSLTSHEWQMAQRLGDDYWLYAVEDALTTPHITCIQNPAAKLHVQEVMGVVEYVADRWQEVAKNEITHIAKNRLTEG